MGSNCTYLGYGGWSGKRLDGHVRFDRAEDGVSEGGLHAEDGSWIATSAEKTQSDVEVTATLIELMVIFDEARAGGISG